MADELLEVVLSWTVHDALISTVVVGYVCGSLLLPLVSLIQWIWNVVRGQWDSSLPFRSMLILAGGSPFLVPGGWLPGGPTVVLALGWVLVAPMFAWIGIAIPAASRTPVLADQRRASVAWIFACLLYCLVVVLSAMVVPYGPFKWYS